jgi:hypothetical protein
LQERVLELLADVEPGWTWTGGAALAGVHLGHRSTRDLDLFWRDCSELGDVHKVVASRLKSANLDVDVLQSAVAFHRLRVSNPLGSVVVDLVADPVGAIEDPVSANLKGVTIHLDSMHEILVNKLCTLLSRSELRDLIDVRELLARGGDLDRALADAPRKDGGFSPLTLAWLLRDLPVESVARAQGESGDDLAEFRDKLVERLTKGGAPD